MKVRCVINNGALLPSRYNALGYTAETVIALRLDKIYQVYGTAIWRSSVSVLVVDEHEFPSWYPVEAFKVVDDTVPNNWFFRYFPNSEFSVQAVWGPERLVKEEGFHDALNDRDQSALQIFRTEFCS